MVIKDLLSKSDVAQWKPEGCHVEDHIRKRFLQEFQLEKLQISLDTVGLLDPYLPYGYRYEQVGISSFTFPHCHDLIFSKKRQE